MDAFIMIYLFLSCMGVGVAIIKHGEDIEKSKPNSTMLSWVTIFVLLYFGNFFQSMNMYHYIYLSLLGLQLGMSLISRKKKINILSSVISFGITLFLFYKAGLIK